MLTWSAAPNNGPARSATLTIADQQFIVSQAGTAPPATNAWVRRFGGASTDYASAVAVDPSGNIYVTGIFATTINFGGADLVSAGSYDTFLAKFTAAGDHVWSKRFGGAAGEVAKSIALDPAGNIFVAGNLQSCSIVKFSPNGDVLWSGGPPSADFASIAVDSQGNVIATGNFAAPYDKPIDFGNGVTLVSQYGAADCFLARYSPNGVCLYAKAFANSGDAEWGYGVAIDKRNDNILLAGYATGQINLGGSVLQNNVYGNTFGWLAKFQPNGTHLWSRRLGVTLATDSIGSSWARVKALAVDANGDAILGGEFHLHTQLANEPIDLASAQVSGTSSYSDAWLAKYSGANGAYQWSNVFRGNRYEYFHSLSTDAQNNVLASGLFYGTCAFGPQSLTTAGNLPTSNSDGFLLRITANGAFTSVQQFGGASDADIGKGVADSIVLVGGFQGTASIGGISLTSSGAQDVLIWKLNP